MRGFSAKDLLLLLPQSGGEGELMDVCFLTNNFKGR